jgi:very-short-patch-repair endonuclease
MTISKEPNATCESCGKQFYRSIAELRRAEHHYCSPECSSEARRKAPNTVCEYCGKAFYRSPYAKERAEHHFCGYACSGASRQTREEGHCAICGKPVIRTQAQRRKSRHGEMFCCRQHALVWQREREGMNGLEQDFLFRFPQLRFVGDGKLWCNDNLGWMSPDFILPATNKVIELWGNFWHRDQNPQDRVDRLANAGYNAIVIWENDFREHPDKTSELVLSFLSG